MATKPRLDTKLESDGPEFLVLGRLLASERVGKIWYPEDMASPAAFGAVA